RMLDQPKAMPYASQPLLPDQAAMQRPPEGTLPADTDRRGPAVVTGIAEGKFVDRIPVPVDRAMLETGRARFETFCAPCHGVLGDGVSSVARVMALRKPVNLHVPPASTDVVGEQFHTVRHGYGLMPSYAVQLSVDDTWAVVAYLEALRVARHAVVADLPPDIRAYLAKELP
ncbi:MAG TPA: cytochrome c, partial [Polyangiaceae bacterium]|nr:cytochrome c [Polyangiaceae bacterium]